MRVYVFIPKTQSSHKLCHLSLESHFNTIQAQFRSAFQTLLEHAGKGVLIFASAHCVAQDETALVSIPDSSTMSPLANKEIQD